MPVITGDWHEYEGKQRRKGKHAGGLDHDIAPPACVSSPFSNKQDSAQTQLPVNKQDEPLTLEVVIAEPYVGMVLGPGGNTLKRIGKRFNMSILPSASMYF